MSRKDSRSTFSIVIGEPPTPCEKDARRSRRPFLGVHFECCNIYVRVYKNDAGTAYEGHCPHCSGTLRVAIGEGGSNSRFFKAR